MKPGLLPLLFFLSSAMPQGGDCSRGERSLVVEDGKTARSCTSNTDCAINHFCHIPDGQCSRGSGVCEVVPEICTADYTPVCGCDGQTYSNKCMAFAHSMSIHTLDDCPANASSSVNRQQEEGEEDIEAHQHHHHERALGSLKKQTKKRNKKQQESSKVRLCGSRGLQPCSQGQFCEFRDGHCGMYDAPGVCTPITLACNRMYRPVCGCDGETYSNACVAKSHQVSIRHEGRCEEGSVSSEQVEASTPIDVSSSITSAATEAGVAAAAAAVAVKKKTIKGGGRKNEMIMEEEENEKLIQALKEGTLDRDAASCGGIAGFQCPGEQVCIFPRGTCGAADEMGTCMVAPFICTLQYQPVCGCDGVTYGNECHAHSKGISIVRSGACEDNEENGQQEGGIAAVAGEEMVDTSVHLRRGPGLPGGL